MLRVGLTGGLGSGKSTVAAMLRAHGAHILVSDDIARELMQPGEPVYAAIVAHFGPEVLQPSPKQSSAPLDRVALARIAFAEGRVEELNALLHPAVIARQAELMAAIAAQQPAAIVITESALIFETTHAGPQGWRSRFDRIILITAPEDLRIARFVEHQLHAAPSTSSSASAVDRDAEARRDVLRRATLTAEARRRMSHQLADSEKLTHSDFVLKNTGSLADLQDKVDALWPQLLDVEPA